jgi:hypothetical protein
MARRSTAEQPVDEVPLYFGLTPNQVVAFNLAQARALRGWTQQEAIDALEPYLGTRWSIANYSAAERSVEGRRIRNFDADEIVAFARGFELAVTWFFMPPPPWAAPGVPVKLRTPDAELFGTPLALLADLVFGTDLDAAHLGMRLDAFLQQVGINPLSNAQQQVVDAVNTRKAALVEHAVRDLQGWQTQLRSLANHLEDLEARSRRPK